MSIKFNVVEDNLSEYLDQLKELVYNKENNTAFLRDAAHEMHFRYIKPLMPEWNPNLIFSPMESQNQEINVDVGLSKIELRYTGFTQQAKERILPEGVWSEFGDKVQGILERDYAFYQETGEDPIAPPEGAKHKFFIKKGTATYNTEFHYKTMAYVDRLMHLQGWKRVSKYYDLDDYMAFY